MAHMPDDGWTFSPPKPEIERVEKFEMTFVVDGEKAYLIGNVATVPVQILHEVEGILFVERTASGTLQINAIDRYGNSVYSRHTFIDKLTPSQHYGQCNYR